MMFKVPEACRVLYGEDGTTEKDGNNGLFEIDSPYFSTVKLMCYAEECDEQQYEFVSVDTKKAKRLPTLHEMFHIKRLFWSNDINDVWINVPEQSDDYTGPPKSGKLFKSTRKGKKLPVMPEHLR